MAAGQQPQVPQKPVSEPLPKTATKVTAPEIPGALPAPVAATGTMPAAVGTASPVAVPDSGQASIYTKKDLPIEQEAVAARSTGEAALPPVPPQTLPVTPAVQPKPVMAAGQQPQVPQKPVSEPLPKTATKVTAPEIPGALPAPVAAAGTMPAAVGTASPVAVPDSGQASIYTKKDLPIEQEAVAARSTGEAALPPVPPQTLPVTPAVQPKPVMAAGQQPQVPQKPVSEPLPKTATKVTAPEIPGALPAPVAATGTMPAAVGTASPVAVPDSGQASIYTKKDLPIEQEAVAARSTGEAALPPVPPQTLPATPAVQPKPVIAAGQQPQVPQKPAVCPTLPDKDYVASYADREQLIVEFDSNSAVLKRKYVAALKDLRKRLKENSSLEVTIEGHADYRGSPAFNLALSRRRAIAVKSFLIRDKGVVAKHINIKAFGCTKPIDDNRTIKGRQKNRRAVVLTIKSTR